MIWSRYTILFALSLLCLFDSAVFAKNDEPEYYDSSDSAGDATDEKSVAINEEHRKPRRTQEQLSKMFQVYTNWFFAVGDHQNLYFFNLNISSTDGQYNLVGNISLHDLYVMYMGGRNDSTKFTKLGSTEAKNTVVVLESLAGVLYLFKPLQVALCKVYKLTGVIDFVIRGDYVYYIAGHNANNKLTLYRSLHAFDQYETTVFNTIVVTSTFVDDVSTAKLTVSANGTQRAITYFIANKLCVLINSDDVHKRNFTITRDRAVLFARRTHMYTFKLKNDDDGIGTKSGYIDRTCLPKDFSYSRNDKFIGSLLCGDKIYDFETNITDSDTLYIELVPRPEDIIIRTKLEMPDSTFLSVSLSINSQHDSNTNHKDLTFSMNHTYSDDSTPLITKHRIFGNIVCDNEASNLLYQYELLRTSEYYMDKNPATRNKNSIQQFKPPRTNNFLERAQQQQISTLTRSGSTPETQDGPSREEESSAIKPIVKTTIDITVYAVLGFSVGVLLLSIIVLILQFYVLSVVRHHLSVLRAEKSHLAYPLV